MPPGTLRPHPQAAREAARNQKGAGEALQQPPPLSSAKNEPQQRSLPTPALQTLPDFQRLLLPAALLADAFFWAAGFAAGREAFLGAAFFGADFLAAAALFAAGLAAGFDTRSLLALLGFATTSLKTLPGLKAGTFRAGIVIFFLVRGLTACRFLRSLRSKVPKPGILTGLPFATSPAIALIIAVTAELA